MDNLQLAVEQTKAKALGEIAAVLQQLLREMQAIRVEMRNLAAKR